VVTTFIAQWREVGLPTYRSSTTTIAFKARTNTPTPSGA